MNHIGDTINTLCETCGEHFTYEHKGGRPRCFCAECAKLRSKLKLQKFYTENIKLLPGQVSARSMDGLLPLARCSQSDASVMLSVMETLELQSETGDSEVFVSPLSLAAIQQIERRALMKIKRAMTKDWSDYKETMAVSSEASGHKSQPAIHD